MILSWAALALAALLAGVGLTHWLRPARFRSLVPDWMPRPGTVIAVSGAVEIALAIGLCVPPVRGQAAAAAGFLFLGYLVPHADAFRHVSHAEKLNDRPFGIIMRLAANLGYAALAFAVALAHRHRLWA
ncbi:hypothetical protein [Amycolatopsis pithecellobii]|uniref:DoxX family membrane protein n=1 Tax=Amycolatopsis pithecellobii TaxID=664692 RepID=A0A6N7YUI2_9PSEU|nr:hypothetical protein [Amycolatopsis pithecellobii]MTD55592.1 hypothetical protein [Amycolatopsis pithecellobii]